jgi:hypothetical protein
MNGRDIPGANLFRLYVYDKEMSKCLNHFKNILKEETFNQLWTDFLPLL